MASAAVRTMTLRRLLRPSATTLSMARKHGNNLHKNLGAALSSRSFASISTGKDIGYVLSEHEQKYHDMGWLDDRGLTQFSTLHENQVRSCKIFATNPLYGVHNDETEEFEYSTYAEFEVQVNKARHVLQDLGKFNIRSPHFVMQWRQCSAVDLYLFY